MKLISMLLVFSLGFAWPFGSKISETRHMSLGTIINLRIYERGRKSLLRKAVREIDRYDTLFDPDNPEGDIYKINHAGAEKVPVQAEVYDLLKTAVEFSDLSHGYFDPTVGRLVKLWGIGTSSARIPSETEIQDALQSVGWEKIHMDGKDQTVRLENSSTQLDLGAIAKGYICDRVTDLFRKEGVSSALINMGGNVYALGKKPDDSLFRVGIQSPFHKRGTSLGYVQVHDKAVVTSGNYERFFERDGVRYHHILDPETGYPHTSGLAAVSVIADSAVVGDALSTTLFIAGLKEGLSIVNSLHQVQAVFVMDTGKVYLSNGLEDSFVLTHSDFHVDISP